LTIKKIFLYVTLENSISIKENFLSRLQNGDQSILFRFSRVLEKSKGYNKTLTTHYLGDRNHLMFRYRYQYKDLLYFEITGDKDAGEQFFRGAQSKGFDFYSFHFFVRKLGSIGQLALGDFTVRMGQGLIHWQGMSFRIGSDMMSIKRQGPALSPYRSAGEYYFFRGGGLSVKMGKIECTGFISCKKTGGQINIDTVAQEKYISTFQTSGYYRSLTEVVKKNNVSQIAAGTIIKYRSQRWNAAINGIYYQFSLPLRNNDEPYDLFSITGKSWYNLSADYSFTFRNMHLFGELAIDKEMNHAIIQGLVISADPKCEISFLYRKIGAEYQSVSGQANTQNSSPTNEEGMYAGITVRPFNGWRIDAFVDTYVFPWLKYQVDAPSRGQESMVQITYAPVKAVEIYAKYKTGLKQVKDLQFIPRQTLRLNTTLKLNPSLQLRNRCEILWYDKKNKNAENGFLFFSDVQFHPGMKKYGCTIRTQYFETSGYDSRIYAYENDVLYEYAVPAFYDKGWRYYLIIEYNLSKKIGTSLRLAQTIYTSLNVIGTGLDEISDRRKTEIKLIFFLSI